MILDLSQQITFVYFRFSSNIGIFRGVCALLIGNFRGIQPKRKQSKAVVMPLNARQLEILDQARVTGQVMVDDLAEAFNVSVQTIRKDLSELSEAGKLDRVHGGALFPSGVANIGYLERAALNAQAKARIAKSIAAAIPDGSSLFLNIGTSTEAVARALLRHKDLMVVTNNINVANILVENPDCEIMVTGGSLRRADGGLVGSLALRIIEQFKFDFAVVGCSAVDSDGDLLDFDLQEVGVSQAIIKQARKVFLAADHSKFQRSAPVRIGSLSAVDRLFTDQLPSKDTQKKCADLETEITVVN